MNNNTNNTGGGDRIMRPSEVTMLRDRDTMPKNVSLAMAYVPFQMWSDDLYDLEQGLERGTIFPELFKPFLGGRGGRDER
ncbi:MAG: spore coat associated protein CotJA [Eubacteriales bacterium]|nr:spore coat associated protein CotJA [Eubacteriales bacterium]MDD4475026.1 spore coat associated protein CotJA [Eubacteriales bacterium]